jgi:hypothetical protein
MATFGGTSTYSITLDTAILSTALNTLVNPNEILINYLQDSADGLAGRKGGRDLAQIARTKWANEVLQRKKTQFQMTHGCKI